jgi:putative ABC transport system ATP-binding protein
MIQLKNVSKSYRRGDSSVTILRDISLKIQPNEFIAIMGPSGSGKSTLLNILGCLDKADSGYYMLKGEPVKTASEDDLAAIRNRSLGFIFQSFNLIPRINAKRNVELPMVYAGVKQNIRNSRSLAALKIVGLEDRANYIPSQLSGGQQQRVAIARALVNDPEIIIADEPTGSLDSTSSKEIMKIFQQLHACGKTIIMVTHEIDIARYSQRIINLSEGRINNKQLL